MAHLKGAQKVIIPAGTLNPDENNVIEIPIEASRSEIVVAKPLNLSGPRFTSTPIKQPRRVAPPPPIKRPTGPPPPPPVSRPKIQRPRGPPPPPPHQSSSKSVLASPDMEELEAREKRNIQDDLKNFQISRRRLFFNVVSLQMAKVKKICKKKEK